MECAGRAKRRRRFSFIPHHPYFSGPSWIDPHLECAGRAKRRRRFRSFPIIPISRAHLGSTPIWSAPAERSGDGAFVHSPSSLFLGRILDRPPFGVRRQSEAATALLFIPHHPYFSGASWIDPHLECAGRAKRRRRFLFIPHHPYFSGASWIHPHLECAGRAKRRRRFC